MLRYLLAVIFLAAAAAPAAGAPIWFEKVAAPKARLLDPRFALFDETSAIRIDHARWADFLRAYLVTGADGVTRVNYRAVDAPARDNLDLYVAALERVSPGRLSRAEQLAFWINLYNATTVRLILDHPGVRSIREIGKPWDIPVATIDGRALTLNEIEHGVLRPVFRDPRLHYAVNCASLGCPNLAAAPYRGAEIEAGLDRAARAYVNDPRGVSVAPGRVTVSKIYGWYAGDFGGSDAAILEHLRRYADPALVAALSRAGKIDGYRYDWALNAAE
jgi:hypothetical protein